MSSNNKKSNSLFVLIYKLLKKIISLFLDFFNKISCIVKFKGNGVIYKNFNATGKPYVMVARGGTFIIGDSFAMHNGIKGNPIGCYSNCTFFVDRGAELVIGEGVGISQTAIICHKSITIGNFVKIGGGVKIYDTDFHSLDPEIRASKEDVNHRAKSPVVIEEKVFIGAYSVILKGVTIGENSIIGAGSVVTKSVPKNEIWGGNPAKKIRSILPVNNNVIS